MEELNLNIERAVLMLLNQIWKDEFIERDRMFQHPSGENFYEWLFKNELITEQKIIEIREEIVKEDSVNDDTELGKCLEENCNEPAKKDYNGLEHNVCDYHYKKLCDNEEYR